MRLWFCGKEIMDNNGRIIGIQGEIVEVEFLGDKKPRAHEVLTLVDDPKVQLEVVTSASQNTFYTLLFERSEKVKRGAQAINTHKTLEVPVGDSSLGRIINVLGQPIDGKGDITGAGKSIYGQGIS